jgi:hypothetical protein
MPSFLEYGKRDERERNKNRKEMQEIDETTNKIQDEVETTKRTDEAGTTIGAERRKRRREKSENDMRGVEKDGIPKQEMNEAKEGNEKMERNASRNMKTENDGKEEVVLNGRSEHMSTPTRRRSQRVAEAITIRNNRGTKVTDYEELDTSLMKYRGNW